MVTWQQECDLGPLAPEAGGKCKRNKAQNIQGQKRVCGEILSVIIHVEAGFVLVDALSKLSSARRFSSQEQTS